MLLFRYFPYWPLFVLLVLLSCVAAWDYTRFLTPLYESSATILIKDESPHSGDAAMMEALNLLPYQKNVENEIEVLQSRTFMKQVVNKLHLYAAVFEEGNIQAVPAYNTSPVIIISHDPDKVREQNSIYFSYDDRTKTVKIGNHSYPLNSWVNTPYGILMFEKNEKQNSKTIKPLFFNLVQPSVVANGILANLSVFPVKSNSSVIALKLKDHVPSRGEDILNGLCQAYYQASINDKNKMASNTLAFVEDRIRYVESDLDSLEKSIQNYKATKGITNLSSQGQLFLENVGSNDKRIAEINLQLAILNQVEKYVVSKDNSAGIVPSTLGLTDPLLNQLLQKLYESDLLYEKMRKTTGENNPALLTIKTESDKIRPTILESIHNLRASLLTSVQNINSSKNESNAQLSTIPQKEKELLDFSRQQAIKSSVYTFLLQKREETALSRSSTVADNEIIDAAESSMIPNSPSKSVIYLMAMGLGILLGIGFITAREVFSSKILFRSEIESLTSIPIAAELAKVKDKASLVVDRTKHLFLAEQFRQLRTTIGLYGKIKSKRKLLITSNISGEGKSFVSSNLALSLALSGKRVILVDLDLRKSNISKIFNLTKEKGAIEFLEGICEPYEVIKSTDHDKLFVVPAGTGSSNLAELLLDGRLDTLFKFLEDTFDFIIVDSSPIDPVADAYALSEYCDTTLFIVRHGYTPKTLIQLMDENHKIKIFKNLAIVFNGIKSRGFIKKGYGFGYGYGYENIYKDYIYRRKPQEI